MTKIALIVIALALLPLALGVASGLIVLAFGLVCVVTVFSVGAASFAAVMAATFKYPVASSAIVVTLALVGWTGLKTRDLMTKRRWNLSAIHWLPQEQREWEVIKRGHEERERVEREALENSLPISKRIKRFL